MTVACQVSDAINLLQNDPLVFIIAAIAIVSIFSLFIFAIYFNFIPAKIAAQYRQIRERSLLYLGILGLVSALVLIFIAFIIVPRSNPNIAAKVGGESITLDSVKNLATNCSISNKRAVKILVDEKVLGLWVADEGIEISSKEQSEEEIRIGGVGEVPLCIKTRAKVNLLREKLSQNLQKFREGKFIAVNFGRYNVGPPYGEIADKTEREKKLKEERGYADKLLDSIYADLQANKLSFEEAMKKVQKDPRVGLNSWYGTTLQSGSFSAADYIDERGLVSFDGVREKVDALSVGEFSKPFVQKSLGLTGTKETLFDERWIIAEVDRIGKGVGGTKEDLLRETRNNYGAKIYL